MKRQECNPNHCPVVKEMATSLIKLEQQNKEMLDFILHLYVNYELPYGTMDIETKKRFKDIIEKSKR